jgi:hypothetical protein
MSLPVGLPVASSRTSRIARWHEPEGPNPVMTITPNRSAK